MNAVTDRPHPARYALCPPTYFDVNYRINPWMDPAGWNSARAQNAQLAQTQWQGLRRVLADIGVALELAPPQPGLPDMVFTANGGLVLDRKALLPAFLHPERQGETPHFRAFFETLRARGLIDAIHAPRAGVVFEGAGDCLWDPARRIFWMGWGQRSSREAAAEVARVFGRDVVPLELVDPRYYHLDVSLRPLARGHVLYHPQAFNAEGRAAIEVRVTPALRIPVSEEDVAHFAVNAVTFGDHIILSTASADLRARLEQAGYIVHQTPLWAFHRSGGSALCLTLRLDERSDGVAAGAALRKTTAA